METDLYLTTHPPTRRVQHLIQTTSFSSTQPSHPASHPPTHPQQVQRCLKERKYVHQRLYLVKWKDLGYGMCTWETPKVLNDDKKIEVPNPPTHPPTHSFSFPFFLHLSISSTRAVAHQTASFSPTHPPTPILVLL